MTRLEALRLIRNGPTHPAMMRMTEEREHKNEFPSWIRFTSGKNLFQDFLPYEKLSLYYITLFWNAREFSGRPEHVPWREVSSHLIALSLLSCASKSLPSWTLMRDGNGESVCPFLRTQVSNWLALDCIELHALLIRCCKLRAIKSQNPTYHITPAIDCW